MCGIQREAKKNDKNIIKLFGWRRASWKLLVQIIFLYIIGCTIDLSKKTVLLGCKLFTLGH